MESKKEENFVRVPLVNHTAIHGQFGNIRQRIRELQRMLVDEGHLEYVPVVEKIHIELEFLERYYPAFDPDVPF